jgi:hypothetical protein
MLEGKLTSIARLELALRIGTTPSTARKSKSMAANNKIGR